MISASLAPDALMSGVSAALFFWIIILKMKHPRRWLKHEIALDVVFSLALVAFFHGTYNGGMTAMIGGVTLSAMLRLTRLWIGYEYWCHKRRCWVRTSDI